MSFENKFYSVNQEELTKETAIFNITINDAHEIFEGHFPENPITPGVMQIEIIKELLSRVVGKKLSLVFMGNCKFLAILNPKTTTSIDIVLNYRQQEDGGIKVSAQIKKEEVIYLKVSALYQ
ncbi:MAG: 3-hydroxyacyl-[acyl-carrier-protein] dehydratase [Crocinitomix sp.]|jgi:3-hydroxyacyl-[acyl-carrier-protein] dehydratase